MKTLKLFILVSILGLYSCGIERMELKPDFTSAGKQMFVHSEGNVYLLTDWLDMLLKMNTYIQTPDAGKLVVEDKYFTNYKIRNSAPNVWSLIQQSDTIYKIYVDGTPFTSAGALWKFKSKDMPLACPFSCVNSTKWTLNVTDFSILKYYPNIGYNSNSYDYYNPSTQVSYISDSLTFESEITSPANFKEYNFQVTGKGAFLIQNNAQKVQISYTIEQPIKHLANSVQNTNAGKYALSAIDTATLETGTASALFESLLGNIKKVTIIYKGRTHVYPNIYAPEIQYPMMD